MFDWKCYLVRTRVIQRLRDQLQGEHVLVFVDEVDCREVLLYDVESDGRCMDLRGQRNPRSSKVAYARSDIQKPFILRSSMSGCSKMKLVMSGQWHD